MRTRGIRGATTATANTREAICAATRELLRQIVDANGVYVEEIASVIFTVTDPLDAAYPAVAAREMGWDPVPLLCAREISVPGGLGFCIRVLVHVNTELQQSQIRHIYLHDAECLRPELAGASRSEQRITQGDRQ